MGKVIKRALRRAAGALAILALLLVALSFHLRRPADPALYPPRGDVIAISVVDHGYHAGLILPRAALADLAARDNLQSLAQAITIFAEYDWVEVGWGEKRFYTEVPAASLSAMPHVLRAMLSPWNESVLHIVGLKGDPEASFRDSPLMPLSIGLESFARIARRIDSSFLEVNSEGGRPIRPGLYGPSAFFKGRDRYHLLSTCNHWVGEVLAQAGLPYAPVESFLSAGLMFDLRRRAGR